MIKNVKYYKSIDINAKEVIFDERKEILFFGRSNVGKSSLMNALFQKKNLVKTSSVPWKTKTANLFLVNNKYYFTDMPWYGFAKMWKEKQIDLDSLINWYVDERKHYIWTIVILIDSKLWAQEKDINMYRHLLDLDLDITIVLTKIDKISNNILANTTNKSQEVFFWQEIYKVSSKTWVWIKELEKILFKKLVW